MINIEAFTTLIRGLKYNKAEDLFVFRKKQYKLRRTSQRPNKRTPYVYYFINVEDVSDIRIVTATKNGIPSYDDFNKTKIDFKKMRKYYTHKYHIDRRTPEEQMIIKGREFFRKKSQQLKELIKEDLKQEKEPKYCEKCGKEFIPVRKSQKFCTTECRISYFSELQLMQKVKKNRMIKKCPICRIKFEGDKREVYCSDKCREEASKERTRNKRMINKKGRNIEEEKD